MSKRSPESQALHDGFERYVLPVLAPLGFSPVDVPKESRAVGWTILAAECVLPSGARVRMELQCPGTSAPRFHLTGPSGGIDLICTESDPAYPKRTTVSHAMSYFEALGDARQGGEQLAARRMLGLEFLAAELAATSEQLVAAVPEIGARVEVARQAASWRDAAARARKLWEDRNMRSGLEDRPLVGTFAFFGAGLVIVQVEGERFTFRFDTSQIDRTRTPVVSGWWTTPAGTRQPSKLIVGDVSLTFDTSGKLIGM